MSLPISRSALDALGKRLRRGSPTDEDRALLLTVLDAYQAALDAAQALLSGAGLTSTSRVKSTATLVEKLQRGSSFKSVQDVAGARIVVPGGCAVQDDVVSRIVAVFGPDSRVVDRRSNPMHGYRAVHVIVTCEGLPLEIQVRTEAQDVWAQTMERLADRWGRGLRYGEPLESADVEILPGVTRGELLDLLFSVGSGIADFENIQKEANPDDVAFTRLEAATSDMLRTLTGLFSRIDDILA